MQISEAAGGVPAPGAEPCRFPKLEECAHFHYERVQLPAKLTVTLQTNIDQSLHSQHTSNEADDIEWYMVQVSSGEECWLLQRNLENFKLLDVQLHQCIYDRKISHLADLNGLNEKQQNEDIESKLKAYLETFSDVADNSINCGPVLNWLQMDNKGHRLLVPSEESRSINTPAVAAAYSVRRYVSQARDELNLEVGDMISVIDMASPGESMWWRGKRGFQVGFFPQHCVHIIGDKVPRNMPLPPPVVGSLALSPIKPVLRKHGKLITFFRSFILNRPSRRRLKQSGILKERVFGCDLGEHLSNSGHDIPMVLKCCAEFIEKNGIVDGIYRLSGITSNIQKLRNAFDEDRIPNLYTEDILQDIHSVASLLKMYFRELPNPLCTYQLYQSFVNAVQGCNSASRSSESDHDRLLKMREAVQKLPPPHYRTLEYLMRHLAKVAKHGSNTGMTTRNVAIVWAPNLLRCAELEVGGVAALQGVGVQAVVTEFLICYAHLIFCDHLPSLDVPVMSYHQISPKKCRPKSLAISTPTKLITLEEARSKHLLSKNEECNYIEVGGGPKNLPKKYHTVIELPGGARKRSHNTKRSPLGWRSLFSKARNNSSPSSSSGISKNRKASTPGIIIAEKSQTESDLTDLKLRKLRSVKSAESLTSGHSDPLSIGATGGGGMITTASDDILGPLYTAVLSARPPGHNRSVSHDSYFDTLQNSQNNSEGSLLDLSEIQLNFELEESEMRIFSEDESLVSSPRVVPSSRADHHHNQQHQYRRVLTRARPEEFSSAANSGNPSPKKQARVVLDGSNGSSPPTPPDSSSRKRTRLEDQLSDIQFIDCGTPDNLVCTMALVHQPKNKSPRNSEVSPLCGGGRRGVFSPRSDDVYSSYVEGCPRSSEAPMMTPTPQSPSYKQLEESSNTTPDFSPGGQQQQQDWNNSKKEVTTTISITYKSPPRSIDSSPVKNNPANAVYENVIEKAVVPTSTASLPNQEASQPGIVVVGRDRPKSLSALEDDVDVTLRQQQQNFSSNAVCDTSENISLSGGDFSSNMLSSARSSRSNVQYTPSLSSYRHMADDSERVQTLGSSGTDLSITSQTSVSLALNSTPTLSPTRDMFDMSKEDLLLEYSSGGGGMRDDRRDSSREDLDDYSSNPIGSSREDFDFSGRKELADMSAKVVFATSLDSSREDLVEFSLGDDGSEFRMEDDVKQELDVPPPGSEEEPNLIDFSPVMSEEREKRKEEFDDSVYQQVKFFRRSVHEINELLELGGEAGSSDVQQQQQHELQIASPKEELLQQQAEDAEEEDEINYDSLEAENVHVYENLNLSDAATPDLLLTTNQDRGQQLLVYENVDFNQEPASSHHVEERMSGDEEPPPPPVLPTENNSDYQHHHHHHQHHHVLYPEDCSTSGGVDNSKSDLLVASDLNFESRKNEHRRHHHQSPPCLDESKSGGRRSRGCSNSDTTSPTMEKTNNFESHKETGNNKREEKVCVKELTSRFEQPQKPPPKRFYEKDSLPPCLRARNLKHQLKTRSLDEEEFKKEFGEGLRRKSLDESQSYKTNSLPKTLNPPKILPISDEDKLNAILHMAHSSENLSSEEELKKRERIEKYKEERRKFLSEKYRSESFKEDKDVLLSKLKVFKAPSPAPPPTQVDKQQQAEQEDVLVVDFKSRAKVFGEVGTNKNKTVNKRVVVVVEKNKSECDEDFIRKKYPAGGEDEKRRHTYESRDRETDRVGGVRRVSVDSKSPRKEKSPSHHPSYCIKDMKAIFESKSKP